jgi:molybdopterin-guanine dinucleotide biosynthesis protein B
MKFLGIAGHSGMGKTMLLLGNDRWALMHELRGAEEPPLDDLLDHTRHCDLVLIEGFKNGGFPTLEVWRAAVGKPTLWPDWPGIVALASDGLPSSGEFPEVHSGLHQLRLESIAEIADFVLKTACAR